MGRCRLCCNPFNKDKHKNVYKGLIFISNNYNAKFKDFIGLYMCNSCKRSFYKGNIPKISNKTVIDEALEDTFEDLHDQKMDPTFECPSVDASVKMKKINNLLSELGEPPIKKILLSSSTQKSNKTAVSIMNKNFGSRVSMNDNDGIHSQQYLNDIKTALFEKKTRAGKICVLTTLPSEWSKKMIRREFGVSRRMITQAKKLRENSGFAIEPPKKKGKTLLDSTCEKVRNFYLSDDVSRMMPGMKDCISVVKEGSKIRIQKRLLLSDLQTLHDEFKIKYPELKIGLTKFRKLRPRECILAGQSGTHNVCVCKIHQNMKLKINGLKQELKKQGVLFDDTCRNLIDRSVCREPLSSCFLTTCENCPGVHSVIEYLKELLENNNVEKITFSQWISTDR